MSGEKIVIGTGAKPKPLKSGGEKTITLPQKKLNLQKKIVIQNVIQLKIANQLKGYHIFRIFAYDRKPLTIQTVKEYLT